MKSKRNQAHNVRTERLELRVPVDEMRSINAHCSTNGHNRSAWVRATLKSAILKAQAYRVTPITIDARDAAVMAGNEKAPAATGAQTKEPVICMRQ